MRSETVDQSGVPERAAEAQKAPIVAPPPRRRTTIAGTGGGVGLATPGPVVPPAVPAVVGALLDRLRRRETLLCALLCTVWFGLSAGLRPLAIPDEGRYVGIAWEMLRHGDWSVPTLNGAPFFHKPPLFYWLSALSMAVFGPGVWAARLASVLATTAAATLMFRFARRWQDARTGWTTVVVLATLPLFYGSSQYANLDPLVAACITVAILCGADAVLRGEAGSPGRGPLVGAFAAAACGVLAKGLIGIVLPSLVLLGWGLVSGRFGRVARTFRWPAGWAVFLAIAAPWFLAMQWRFADFGHYFFVVQHFDRFAGARFNNAQPLWFYPAVLVATAAPWSPWWLLRVRRSREPGRDPHRLGALMVVWPAVVTVFFSLPQSKPIGYVLPALPPLAWWVADAVGTASRPQLGRAAFVTTLGVAATLCVGAVAALHFLQPKSQAALAAELQARRAPGEPVAFIGNYWFDIPFYARLDAPVRVVDAWSADEVAKDSWRRELVDAERFVAGGAPRRLVRTEELRMSLAPAHSGWVVGPSTAALGDPWLASQTLVFEHDGTALWHVFPTRPASTAPPAP